jgi:hypothetical protein
MNWFWINMPLAAVFFLAITGIPLWLTIKRPDTGPQTSARPRVAPRAAAPARQAAAVPVASVAEAPRSRDLVGARR